MAPITDSSQQPFVVSLLNHERCRLTAHDHPASRPQGRSHGGPQREGPMAPITDSSQQPFVVSLWNHERCRLTAPDHPASRPEGRSDSGRKGESEPDLRALGVCGRPCSGRSFWT